MTSEEAMAKALNALFQASPTYSHIVAGRGAGRDVLAALAVAGYVVVPAERLAELERIETATKTRWTGVTTEVWP